MKKPALLLSVGAVGVSLLAVHCSSGTPDCNEAKTCGTSSGGVSDAGADVVAPPEGCDPSADPKDAPKCVANDFALFVDATNGNDSNAGTRESPMKTITGAVAKVGAKPRIYMCEGTYAEHVKLSSGVSLYGGFACTSWTYSGVKAKIAPSDVGYALHVDGVTSGVTYADLDMTAADATQPGGSSIAVFLSNASNVTIRRASATAGKGKDGADGSSPADFAGAAPPGKNGNAAANPGEATSNPQCTTSIGAAGGGSAGKTDNGDNGVVAIAPVYPNNATGTGGAASSNNCNGGSAGNNGSYGPGGGAGTGATSIGMVTADGWKPSDGSEGGKGTDGQGGGGGAKLAMGGIGGGGGAGGCGGAGGGKGQGGGASIALLSFQSVVSLQGTTLTAHDAGRGGNGGKGQKGQLAGTNGLKSASNLSCDGGSGGIGGSGGGGGGGAGGLSAGIVYKGTAPKIEGADVASADTHATVTLGAKGGPGALGAGGDAADTSAVPSKPGTAGTAGVDGMAKAVLSVP